jgi:hypothetical protein
MDCGFHRTVIGAPRHRAAPSSARRRKSGRWGRLPWAPSPAGNEGNARGRWVNFPLRALGGAARPRTPSTTSVPHGETSPMCENACL